MWRDFGIEDNSGGWLRAKVPLWKRAKRLQRVLVDLSHQHHRLEYLDRYSTTAYVVFMKDSSLSSDLLRGHTDTMVLKVLASCDQYGFGIAKQIHEMSGGVYDLKEATLYASLRRLEADGFVTAFWGDESQGGRRKYYRISDSGKDLYRSNKRDWEIARDILDRLL
jgi:DNA-binding PadR family transcriptional regulator